MTKKILLVISSDLKWIIALTYFPNTICTNQDFSSLHNCYKPSTLTNYFFAIFQKQLCLFFLLFSFLYVISATISQIPIKFFVGLAVGCNSKASEVKDSSTSSVLKRGEF